MMTPEEYIVKVRTRLRNGEIDLHTYGKALRSVAYETCKIYGNYVNMVPIDFRYLMGR